MNYHDIFKNNFMITEKRLHLQKVSNPIVIKLWLMLEFALCLYLCESCIYPLFGLPRERGKIIWSFFPFYNIFTKNYQENVLERAHLVRRS